jgi:hypothetical protein
VTTMTNNEILDEIELAVSNKAHLHVEDKRRIACIFFGLLQKGKFDLGDIEGTIDALPEYSKSSKDTIKQIAFVIDLLTCC